MANETVFLLSIVTSLFLVFLAGRVSRTWLFGTIAMNLTLVGVFGSHLIEVFGFTTNAGNVFYASVFFATYLLLDRDPKSGPLSYITFGVGAIGFFYVSSMFVSLVTGGNAGVSGVPSVLLASAVAYVFAQHTNILLYRFFKGPRWLAGACVNVLAQGVDSCLFFTIAFPDLPGTVLLEVIVVGWVIKSAVVILGIPLLALDAGLRRKFPEKI